MVKAAAQQLRDEAVGVCMWIRFGIGKGGQRAMMDGGLDLRRGLRLGAGSPG